MIRLKHKWVFVITLFIGLMIHPSASWPDKWYQLKAPRASRTIFAPSQRGTIKVKIQDWFCTHALKKMRGNVKKLIDNIKKMERANASPLLLKRQLLSLADTLIRNKSLHPEDFWLQSTDDLISPWVWSFHPKPGRNVKEKTPCYTLEDLQKAKQEALRWAQYIREEYRDARESL